MIRATLPPPPWCTVAVLEAFAHVEPECRPRGLILEYLAELVQTTPAAGKVGGHYTAEAIDAALGILEALELLQVSPDTDGPIYRLADAVELWVSTWCGEWPATALPGRDDNGRALRWAWHPERMVPAVRRDGAWRVCALAPGWRWACGAPGVALHPAGPAMIAPLGGAGWQVYARGLARDTADEPRPLARSWPTRAYLVGSRIGALAGSGLDGGR